LCIHIKKYNHFYFVIEDIMASESVRMGSFEEIYSRYRVFILDIDGTIINGDAQIEGTLESVYRLMTDETKKVLFFTNGGYCTL
jgi:hypothetical protein